MEGGLSPRWPVTKPHGDSWKNTLGGTCHRVSLGWIGCILVYFQLVKASPKAASPCVRSAVKWSTVGAFLLN